MVKRRTGLDPLAYMGVEPQTPSQFVQDNRNPTTNDYDNFNLMAVWLNTSTFQVWMLVSKANFIATWREFTASAGALNTLTGDVGGAVPPTAGNIDLQGSGPYIFTGNPGASLITLSDDGTVATTYDGDIGSAQAAGGILNIVGGTHVSTTAAGDTITINVTGNIPASIPCDVGIAVPAVGVLNVFGADGIATSGAGNTVTVGVTSGVFVKTLTGNAGGAVGPDGADNINIVGAGGITVTGNPGTNTLTISGAGSSGGLNVKVTKFTANDTFVIDPQAVYVSVVSWNGGGGGGSGRQGVSTLAGGGSGGSGGSYMYLTFFANQFDPLGEVVTIGAGGTGGAAQAGANTNGNDGSPGGVSSLGNIFVNMNDTGLRNSRGIGGSDAAIGVNGGINQAIIVSDGNAVITSNGGGTGRLSDLPSTTAPLLIGSSGLQYCASGAGAGVGADSVTEQQAGNGGDIVGYGVSTGSVGATVSNAGGVGGLESGTIDGGAGNNFISTTGGRVVGATGGGGGGGQSVGLVAGNGGNGGIPSAGGGGGGGSLNGTNSGAGGDGGRGEIWVYEYLGTLTT